MPSNLPQSLAIGLIADIHGDADGFLRAMRIFEREGVASILCAGDIVDRGGSADLVVRAMQRAAIPAVKGNHEHTVIQFQDRWRANARSGRLARVGRVVDDATLAFIAALPDTLSLTIAGTRLLLAHGTPWSDVMDIFPDSQQGKFDQLRERYGGAHDVVILGHTHRPMQVRCGDLWIVNPGSVYGVTIRDSHTCATLALPDCTLRVFDLASGDRIPLAVTRR